MNNKDYIKLYKLNKTGVHNNVEKVCICGEKIKFSEKVCPKCGTKLPNSQLININKDSALSKRFETIISEDVYEFRCYWLLSNGFELYENLRFSISFNKATGNVKISDEKYFKTLKDSEDFNKFMEDNFPKFIDYAYKCMSQCRYDYMVEQFTSLSEIQISNLFHVYTKYHAMIPHLMGYKVLYFGKSVNLKDYSPATDFNDVSQVEKLNWILPLFSVWDIKNIKYAESIIDISEEATEYQRSRLVEIVAHMVNKDDDIQNICYDEIVKIFGLLFNKEISLEDFIRIYNESKDDSFFDIYEFRALYKKFVKKSINWSEVKELNRVVIGTLKSKKELSSLGISNKNIENIYEILKKNPMEALRKCNELIQK